MRWAWPRVLYVPIRVQLYRRWAWPRVLYVPIRVQFIDEMGVVEGPVCTNQSSVYTGDGRGRGSCMHQSAFSLYRRWAWPRVLYAPIRVQFIQEMGVAEGPVCTNQSSCIRWAWPEFLYAPVRVQFTHEMCVARVLVCTNESSVHARDRYDLDG